MLESDFTVIGVMVCYLIDTNDSLYDSTNITVEENKKIHFHLNIINVNIKDGSERRNIYIYSTE